MTSGLSKLAWAVVIGLVACDGGDGGKGRPTDSAPTGDDDDDDDTTEPVAVEVFINEVMAQNRTTLEDETGAFPDWIELYNAGTDDVDLEGYWLTDDVQNVFKWRFPPDAIIEAGGYLVVFCDQDTADGPLHASFELGGLDGEDVALFGENVDDNPLIDKIEDMALARPDTSVARMPDGGPTIQEDGTATPGASNE